MLQALIFDVDGTLADAERCRHRITKNLAFREAGLDWHGEDSLCAEPLAVRGGKERPRHYIDSYRPDFTVPKEAALDDFIDRLHRLKRRHFEHPSRSGTIAPRPGVMPLLREARAAKLRQTIATTSTLDSNAAVLRSCFEPGFADWFEVISVGDVIARKKPAPDIYLYVLDKFGLTSTECLAFEDSKAGLRAASVAGIAAVVAVNRYTRNEDFAGAVAVVENPEENDRSLRIISGIGGLEKHSRSTITTLRGLNARRLCEPAATVDLALH